MTKEFLSRNIQPNLPINTIHLGLGAFYRAFCCNYFQEINELKKDSIRVLGVSLKTQHLVNKLKKQQGVFTALEKGKEKTLSKKIECIQELLFAQENPKYLLKSLANEEVTSTTNASIKTCLVFTSISFITASITSKSSFWPLTIIDRVVSSTVIFKLFITAAPSAP